MPNIRIHRRTPKYLSNQNWCPQKMKEKTTSKRKVKHYIEL